MPFPSFPKVLPQHESLRAILLLRTVTLLCQLSGCAIMQFWLNIELQLTPLLIVLSLLMAFNVCTWQRTRRLLPVGHRALFGQLLIDTLALSALLYFSGGATNPFASFYLPVLAVAAALLPWRFALLLTLLSIASYSLMTSFYVPLHINDPDRAISYHLAGMWANFAVSAALITWFVARLSRALRQRDAELASARERFLAQERMSALGMQAANAAHEMGTPLSTVAILAEDLLRETDGDAALARYREDFSTIEAQIGLCKSALQRLGASSGAALDTAAPTPIAIWLAQFMDTWRLRHPAAQIDLSLKVDEARIKETESAAQILTILLDNAAQAADDDALIRVCASCEDGHAMLAVIDNGPGITPDLLPRLGRQQVASSTNGQGIGLVLAFATARRIGANINLSAHTGGGTMATLSIPLA